MNTNLNLDDLDRIAQDATLVTTGNGWIADAGGIVLDPDREGNSWDGTIVCEVPSTENAHRKWHLRDHIAAFDPSTVLALIARLREAEAALSAVRGEARAWIDAPASEAAPCREAGALFAALADRQGAPGG